VVGDFRFVWFLLSNFTLVDDRQEERELKMRTSTGFPVIMSMPDDLASPSETMKTRNGR
jgi:hypothetical protein